MDLEISNSDVIKRLSKSIIEVIGRRTSQSYAIAMLSKSIRAQEKKYSFLRFIEIKNIQYSEIENLVKTSQSLESIDPTKIGEALQVILKDISSSMGKNIGFFFMREIKEKMGPKYQPILGEMGVDLNFMQFNYVIDRKQDTSSDIGNSDVVYRIIKSLIEVLDKTFNRSFAISFIEKTLFFSAKKYEILEQIQVRNVKNTLGSSEVIVDENLNSIDPQEIGKAMEFFIISLNDRLGDKGGPDFIQSFKKQLTNEYLSKINDLGINLKVKQYGNELVFRHILNALVEVLSKASTEKYAIFAMNTFLRKIDTKFDFLKNVKIDYNPDNDGIYDISIMTNLENVSQTDARRAIQEILEKIIEALGENIRESFIEDFKNSLETDYLERLEQMGVNLYMIQLKENFRSDLK